MKKFTVLLSCGCCEDELAFETEEACAAAFQKMGLTSSGDCVDDEGVQHSDIDTFYGWSCEGEAAPSSLHTLLDYFK